MDSRCKVCDSKNPSARLQEVMVRRTSQFNWRPQCPLRTISYIFSHWFPHKCSSKAFESLEPLGMLRVAQGAASYKRQTYIMTCQVSRGAFEALMFCNSMHLMLKVSEPRWTTKRGSEGSDEARAPGTHSGLTSCRLPQPVSSVSVSLHGGSALDRFDLLLNQSFIVMLCWPEEPLLEVKFAYQHVPTVPAVGMSARIRMYHASVWRAHSITQHSYVSWIQIRAVVDHVPSFRTRLPRLTPETMGWWRQQRKRWNNRHQRAASRKTYLCTNIPCLPYIQFGSGIFFNSAGVTFAAMKNLSMSATSVQPSHTWNAQHEARSTNPAAWAAGAARRALVVEPSQIPVLIISSPACSLCSAVPCTCSAHGPFQDDVRNMVCSICRSASCLTIEAWLTWAPENLSLAHRTHSRHLKCGTAQLHTHTPYGVFS